MLAILHVPDTTWHVVFLRVLWCLRRNAAQKHHFHPRTLIILHQPQISRFYVILAISGPNLNGVSVSGPPKIGERPYPRQFHPVGFPGFSAIFHPSQSPTRSIRYHLPAKSNINHQQCEVNMQIYITPTYPHPTLPLYESHRYMSYYPTNHKVIVALSPQKSYNIHSPIQPSYTGLSNTSPLAHPDPSIILLYTKVYLYNTTTAIFRWEIPE